MSKNISLLGQDYANVPGVRLPQTNGGMAYFADVTSTTATASDVAQGKVFYAADGTPTVGTASGGGGDPAPVKSDVNFYDYDGTLLHSYTATEAAELTALPNNPSHSGLVAQGWTYTLAEIKAEVTAQGKCDVGQMYVTDDDKTRIYCTFLEGRLSPYLGICPDGTVEVDWGDGSDTDTLTGTNLTEVKTVQHTYASAGDYVITLTVSSGSFAFYGQSNGTYLLTKNGALGNESIIYANAVTRIEIGSSVSVSNYAFYRCSTLASVTIPSGVTSIGAFAFNNCYSLASVTIPSGVTSIWTYAFYRCYSIASITIPSGVTSIETYAFSSCYSIASITIPSGVTSIGAYAFDNCYSLASVTISSGVTSIGASTFNYCYSLASVTIPSGVTSIGASAFSGCSTLASVTIPSGVTSIGAYAFYRCYGMGEYHLKPTTPPTLANINAFTSIPSDCKIYVPYSQDHSILAAYQAATKWSTYASYMVEEAAE